MSSETPSHESQGARGDLTPVHTDLTREELTAMRQVWEELARAEPLDPRVRQREYTLGGVSVLEVTHAGADESRRLIYLHGGAYTMGSLVTHRSFAATLALTLAMPVVVVGYRLAPEHPFPAGVEDGCVVYRALLDEGIPPEHIVMAGDSAGGGLALSMLLALREHSVPMPAALLLISPFADLSGSGESLHTKAEVDPVVSSREVPLVAQQYIPGLDPRDPRISSVFASLHGFPPTMIHVGTDEVLLSDAQRLAQRAQEAGTPISLHEWEGMWHCFVLMPALPEAQTALAQIAEFVETWLPRE